MMNIRPYKKGDESQIVWLINNTWRSAYADIFPSEVFDERDRTADARIADFDDKLKRNNRICYVADDNQKIVGVLIGSFNTDIEQYDCCGDVARIIALYIDEKYQRARIGKNLFDEFVKIIKQNKINKFVIGVLEENFKARKAYEKWGGKLTGYTEDFTIANVSRKEVFYEYDIMDINS